MPLSDRVQVARRFQRSVRIDSDLSDTTALDGFICPASTAEILENFAKHVSESGQGAFTWTGPYGSGKSSLVVVLSALLSRDKKLRAKAEKAVGSETADRIHSSLPPKSKGWSVIPVVARRDQPATVIGEALDKIPGLAQSDKETWTEKRVIEALEKLSKKSPNSSGGVILFLDEMGKFLEAAARDNVDVYLFQQLAELASRSKGRLIIVGILHQSFEEYAHRLSREMRDEWSKIQGRFIDLSVNIAGEEQLDLLSRAIESDYVPKKPGDLSKDVAEIIRSTRPGVSQELALTFENCWPLHPIVAASLGPISRRRFGQNQRSVFGFLNSSETAGFQDFLNQASDEALYGPEQLWDYLRLNLEASIIASPDGHRWSIAFEAVERCEGLGGNQIQVDLLKTIALIDLFKDRSGLIASFDLLKAAFPTRSTEEITEAIEKLEEWSLVVFRKFANSYAIFAGSDFDIEDALENALEEIDNLDLQEINSLAGLQPILAKRHYHRTGALRWFDVTICAVADAEELVEGFKPSPDTIGQFLITLPTNGETTQTAENVCRSAASLSKDWFSVVGLSTRSWNITELAKELSGLEAVWESSSELAGDAVARRELRARISETQGQLEVELQQAFENALWHRKDAKPVRLTRDEINRLTSKLADELFNQSPILRNELLNRIKPSSNAVGAQKALLRRMVQKESEPRLGIDGYPAEGGLYASVLEATGIHKKVSGKWKFSAPTKKDDPVGLWPLWSAANEYLSKNNERAVPASELREIWGAPPFGLKEGLFPVLFFTYVIAERSKIAFYRQGIFQANVTDLDVDYLTNDPECIQVRSMDLPAMSRHLLSEMADLVRDLDDRNTLENLEPIDVARGLISVFDNLPAWTKRTMQLSRNAVQIRNLFKQAIDPNKFLFDDIPSLFDDVEISDTTASLDDVVSRVREGLEELRNAYPTLLRKIRETLLTELQVPNSSAPAISELNERADNIRNITGDHRLEAFVGRLRSYGGTDEETEALASLAVNKPPNSWVDPDINLATLGLAELARGFVQLEAFAHIKGRSDKRHAMAVVVGLDGQQKTFSGEFSITDADRKSVDRLLSEIDGALNSADEHQRNVLLGSMAEMIARHLSEREEKSNSDTKVAS